MPNRSTTSSTTDGETAENKTRRTTSRKRSAASDRESSRSANRKIERNNGSRPSDDDGDHDDEGETSGVESSPVGSDDSILDPSPFSAADPAIPHPFPEPLTDTERAQFLALLLRGASRIAACRKLGISLSAVAQLTETDSIFREQLREVQDALSQWVASVLLRKAVEGSVPAQSAYLKLQPPADWHEAATAPTQPMTFDAIYDKLTLEEIERLARALDIDLPYERDGGIDSPAGAEQTASLSG